ncbi:hypothetical protein [Micromonospora sp. HUAS LYJ1]|uniref:hypothetical protein n=1 Tax=Micromonospora sp. HUAS LYJ1 TaxID=3061626 RepID=UPI002670FC28|nr:hypothetical protein [Micromonospora sp. HUAS LYJ1]WKU02439.1 hypothetical protein Q2K16_16025 [Micromonospora sp. HUAS LYJ1]
MSDTPPPGDPAPSPGDPAPATGGSTPAVGDPAPAVGDPTPPASGSPAPWPTGTPGPSAWAPPDPLAVPQPWAAPGPWAHGSAPDPTTDPAGTTYPGWPGSDRPGPAPGAAWPGGPPGIPDGPPAAGWPGGPPGHGWPPPGYPPPFAHPGYPPPGGRTSTGAGAVVGIVVAVVVVLVLVGCACFCGGGILLGGTGPDAATEDPYGRGYYDDEPEPSWSPPQPFQPSAPATRPADGPGRYPVTYEVTGTGPVDLQFYDGDGYFIQQERVRLPWRMELRTDDPNRVLVSAARSDGNPGGFRCATTVGNRPRVTDVAGPDDWRVQCHANPIR